MILDDLRYFHDNPFPSKLRNMQKREIIKKTYTDFENRAGN